MIKKLIQKLVAWLRFQSKETSVAVSAGFREPVQAGNTINVMPSHCHQVVSVTDNLGNTYIRTDEDEWEARNVMGGQTILTVTFDYPVPFPEIEIEENRP